VKNNTEEQAVKRFLQMRAKDPDIKQNAASRIIARELFMSSQTVANYLSKHRRRILAAMRTFKGKIQANVPSD